MQKKPLILKNLDFQTFNLSITTARFFSIAVSIENFPLEANHSIRIILTVQKSQGTIYTESFSYSNRCFSVTTGLISTMKLSIGTFELVQETLFKNSFCFLLQTSDSPNFLKSAFKKDSFPFSNSYLSLTRSLLSSTDVHLTLHRRSRIALKNHQFRSQRQSGIIEGF